MLKDHVARNDAKQADDSQVWFGFSLGTGLSTSWSTRTTSMRVCVIPNMLRLFQTAQPLNPTAGGQAPNSVSRHPAPKQSCRSWTPLTSWMEDGCLLRRCRLEGVVHVLQRVWTALDQSVACPPPPL